MSTIKLMPNYKSISKLTSVALISFSFLAMPVSNAFSQSSGGESGESDGGGQKSNGGFANSFSYAQTNAIAADIGKAIDICRTLPIEYRADCLAQSLKSSASKVRKKAYIPVQNEISTTAQSIEDIVTENLDEEAPVIKVGNKTYRPIKKEAVAVVNERVAKVVTESATRLIRSAGNSITRKIHFQRVAKALDSTKVLMRSV